MVIEYRRGDFSRGTMLILFRESANRSLFQISCRSVKCLLRYGHFSIFSQNGSIRHVEFTIHVFGRHSESILLCAKTCHTMYRSLKSVYGCGLAAINNDSPCFSVGQTTPPPQISTSPSNTWFVGQPIHSAAQTASKSIKPFLQSSRT